MDKKEFIEYIKSKERVILIYPSKSSSDLPKEHKNYEERYFIVTEYDEESKILIGDKITPKGINYLNLEKLLKKDFKIAEFKSFKDFKKEQ